MSPIFGVTVGTPFKPSSILDKANAVKTVNGVYPDENGNVEIVGGSGENVDLTGYATEEYVRNKIAEAELSGSEVDLSGYAQKSELPTKVSQLQNDAGYLTKHQDISGKLDADRLPEVVAETLSQAKVNGEFDGKSAYEIAKDHGFEGSEAEWLESLKGERGIGSDGIGIVDITIQEVI